MLNVYYGKMQDVIYNTSVYFSNVFQKTWLDDEYVRKMIKSVDKSEVIGDYLIKSKALGMIAPTQLSGGVKTLILTYFKPDIIFNATTCGDNCARWFLDMAKKEDRTINLRHIMDFGDKDFEIHILNNDMFVHSMKELVLVAGDFL
ncbi:MAG: DUF4869 domain-containing protein [Lachnospiraceae bacterium]|nr:DUF4869 domain-containing protein [Lachnospiraceae bacterium]